MAENISKSKAFIDNGQIKITDEYGIEYTYCEKRDKYNIAFWNITSCLCSIFLLTSLFFLLIPMLGYQTSTSRGILFFFSSVFWLMMSIQCFYKKECWKDISQSNTAECNIAKYKLQPEIMKLQKVLAQHKAEIIYIEREAKFNFKKKEESKEMVI